MTTKTEWIKRADELAAMVDDLRLENEMLQAELARIKPLWGDAPEWANHLAPTCDIVWWWHENEPYNHGLDKVNVRSTGRDRSDLVLHWYELAEKRPE